jgi:SHS2 domain-containing protein
VSYRYLEDFATADIAFEAEGETLEDLFRAAADATMNVMIEDVDSIRAHETRPIELQDPEIDILLFDFLQELIYYKDAEQLLLRVDDIAISEKGGVYGLRAGCRGERLDPERHEQRADVKAVTLHCFKVERTRRGWEALAILDV